ncbi:DUF4359 domain-containing protein [Lyngbya aestuarii]|uniref:DUF4359 domain-containing protein n=1 Tax=Lyngbya aestuarii TaxID=118322 RepID=UPI00403D95D1
MKSRTTGAIALAVTAILMAVTNPGKQSYIEEISWRVKDTSCQKEQLPVGATLACSTIAPLPHGAIEPILDGYSRRRNYIFFSIYTTDFWGLKNRSIGVGRNFFEF